MAYARRLEDIQYFQVMKLLARANQLAEQGHNVIHMEVGEPDFATPDAIVTAGADALRNGHTRYTAAEGIMPLREAIAGFYSSEQGIEVDPSRILVTAGGSGALLLATALLIDPGNGLLMTDPGYPCNRHFLKSFNGQGQLVPVTSDDGYQLTPALVEHNWQDNTVGVMLASPANPTGAVVPSGDLASIAKMIRERSGYLVVDEIYHGLVYADEPQGSVLGIEPDAFVINSFSKYFGMTGWRLGWLVVPDTAVPEVQKLAQNLFICPSAIAQYAAMAAFTPQSRAVMDSQRNEFRRRRDFLVPALRELGFGIPRMPEGAFYVYASLPDQVGDSESFCDWLLEQHHVAVTPGTDFGFHLANRHVRFSYAQALHILEEGVERIAHALGNLP